LDNYRLGRDGLRWYLELYGPENEKGWTRTRHRIREMDRQTKDAGATFLLALWPLMVGIDDYPLEPVSAEILDFCRRAEIAHIDLREALRGRRAATLWVHPLDKHPNEVAHRLVAERLADLLLTR
jgi:hypothetical protein